MARIAAIFPNESSHYVGMGKEFYARSLSVRKFFDDAEKLLGLELAKTCFLGPKEEQDKLPNAHLITFVNDSAFFDLLAQNRRKPEVLTGIGIGEVAALVCAESIPYLNALQFVVQRSALIEAFAQKHGGESLAISGVSEEQLQPLLAREEGDLVFTHFLSQDTFVVWGPKEAARSLQTELQGVKQVKTSLQLPRGPLFTPLGVELEKPFDDLLTECLGDIPLKNPKIAFHQASDGEYVGTPEAVRSVLTRQYSKPVQWVQTVKAVNHRGFRTWTEVGPGRLYGSLVKKIDKDNLITNLEDVKSLTAAVKVTG